MTAMTRGPLKAAALWSENPIAIEASDGLNAFRMMYQALRPEPVASARRANREPVAPPEAAS